MDTKRIVVITGASSGIGLELKKLFEMVGDTVISISRTNKDNAENFFPCNVSNYLEVQETFRKIKEQFGKIDILVNNAGFGLSGAVELTDVEKIDDLFATDLMGVIYVYKEAVKLMGEGGKILNISSACALFPLPYRGLYASAKAGVNLFSQSMTMECKPFGVQVSSICPGDVKTNFTKNRVKDFTTNERYGTRIETAAGSIDDREDKRMSADYVANKIFNLANKKNMKPFVIIGGKYKALYFLTKICPRKWLLNFTEKFFGGHN